MRKVVFKDIAGKTKKLMLCQAKGGVYLFGYYSLEDTAADWDHFFPLWKTRVNIALKSMLLMRRIG